MVVETKRGSAINKEVESIPLSKKAKLFLRDFSEARQDVQKSNNWEKLDAITPRVKEMEKTGEYQKLRPYVDKIVADTPSIMPIPSGQNHKEVHGEIRFGEIHAAMDEEYISF